MNLFTSLLLKQVCNHEYEFTIDLKKPGYSIFHAKCLKCDKTRTRIVSRDYSWNDREIDWIL